MHEVVSKPHLDRHPDRIWTTVGPVHYIDLRWAEVSREKDWRPPQGAVCIAALLGKRCRRFRPSGPGCFWFGDGSRTNCHRGRCRLRRRGFIGWQGPIVGLSARRATAGPVLGLEDELRRACVHHDPLVEVIVSRPLDNEEWPSLLCG
jgi:hypothetical protein